MTDVLKNESIDWALLDKHRFNKRVFRKLVKQVQSGELTPSSSYLQPMLSPITDIPVFEKLRKDVEFQRAGNAHLRDGKVAVIILNGGMATRFGGDVKGTVEVIPNHSFLELKIKSIVHQRKKLGAKIPIFIMNSFATDEATKAHLKEKKLNKVDDLYMFEQSISLRLTPEGELFLGKDGMPSYCTPGHGDFFAAIKESAFMEQMKERGIEYVFVNNVDNIGATVLPTLLGIHILQENDVTCEVTRKRRNRDGTWETGGSPATMDKTSRIVESFRIPAGFPQSTLPDFSTHNFWYKRKVLESKIDLPVHTVTKKVDNKDALQLETISGDVTLIDTKGGKPKFKLGFVRVPRDGAQSRFIPIKTKGDLKKNRAIIQAKMDPVIED